MTKSPSNLLKISAGIALILSLWNLILSIISLNTPFEHHGEFDAMHDFFESVFLFLICGFTTIQIICAFFLLKLKRGAYITLIILLLIMIPLANLVKTPDLIFCLSEGNCISWVKEVIPVITILCLVICWKEFWKPKTSA